MKLLLSALLLAASCVGGVLANGNPVRETLNPVRFLPAPEGDPVVLVKDGQPAATIVIAEAPFKDRRGVEYTAATELANHVKLATGAAVPLVSDAGAVEGTLILVGESKLTQE